MIASLASSVVLCLACIAHAIVWPGGTLQLMGLSVAVVMVVVLHARLRGVAVDPRTLTGLVAVVLAGSVLTASALSSLPRDVTQLSVWEAHLRPYYLVLHVALVAGVTHLVAWHRASLAEVSVLAALVYGSLNGGFFRLAGARFVPLTGILLVGAGSVGVRPGGIRAFRLWSGETLASAFVVVSLLSSLVAVYPYHSLAMWGRLLTGALVFALVARMTREELERTAVALITVGVVVAVACIHGLWVYARHTSWAWALRARMGISGVHPNALGIYASCVITLAVGLLRGWGAGGLFTMATLLLGALAVMAVSVAARAGWEVPSAVGHVIAYVAPLGAAVWAVSGLMVWRRHGRSAALAHGTATLLVVCLGLTYSRSAASGLLVGLATMVWLIWRSRSHGLRRSVGSVLVGLACVATVGAPLVMTWRTQEATWRRHVWSLVTEAALARPILGWGLDNPPVAAFYDPLPRGEAANLRAWEEGSYPDPLASPGYQWHPHNLFLNVFQSTGAVGLATFLGFLGWLGWLILDRSAAGGIVHRAMAMASAAALVALLLPQLLVLSLSSPSLVPMELWLLAGIVAGSCWGSASWHGSKPGERQKGVWSGLALILMLVLVVPQVAGSLLVQASRRARNVSAIHWACRVLPLNAELRALAGDLADWPHAIGWYRQACRLRPHYPAYQARLGWLLWGTGRLPEGLECVTKAATLQREALGGGSDAQLVRRACDLELGSWIGPHFHQHWSDEGLLLTSQGARDQAVDRFALALAVEPAAFHTPAWVTVGESLFMAEAFERVARTSRVDPEAVHLAAWFAGRSEGQVKRLTPGGTSFSTVQAKAMTRFPNDTGQMGLAAAEVYRRWRLPAREASLYDALVERGSVPPGRIPEVLGRKGMALLEMGSAREAEELFRAAMASRDGAKGGSLVGEALRRQGRPREALAALEAAARSWDPGVPADGSWWKVWHDLAVVHQELGHINEAAQAFAMAHFLLMPAQVYAERLLGLARAAYGTARYDDALTMLAKAVNALEVGSAPTPEATRLAERLAAEALRCYRKRGVGPEETLRDQRRRVRERGPIRRAYWAVLRGMGESAG